MIIFTPADLPKIEPDNWDIFRDIWDKNADWLVKEKQSHTMSMSPIGQSNIWVGLDIYKKYHGQTLWNAPYYDIRERLPIMFNAIESICPFIYRARVLQSKTNIIAHTDDNTDRWNIRALLYPPDAKSQWYFTRPNDPMGERTYINMPDDTNWFVYNDKHAWHGTDYNPENKKILLQLFLFNSLTINELMEKSKTKYSEYIIEF